MAGATLRSYLGNLGFEEEIQILLEDNDVNMEVFRTMTEQELREIGVTSFGVRRKLKLAIDKLNKEENNAQELSFCSTSSDELSVASYANTSYSHQERGCAKIPTRVSNSALSKLNLEDELSANCGGRSMVNYLKAGGRPTRTQRQLLVRVAVASLVMKGQRALWPSATEKTDLAKLIVATFPSTRDSTEGLQGHEHYYHNSAGFIEYRLKTIRTKLKPQPRRQRRQLSGEIPKKPDAASDDEQPHVMTENEQVMVNWMKYTRASQDTKSQHIKYFNRTHEYRRHFIEHGKQKSVFDIIATFPRFQDMPELINLEFGALHDAQQDNFIRKWPLFRDAIITIGKKECPTVREAIISFKHGNVDLCGLYTLSHMLHRSVNKTASKEGRTGSSRVGALLHWIQHLPEGTNVDSIVERKADGYRHPFLVALGPEKTPRQFVIVIDKIAVPAGFDIIIAFDKLFKCHYVFNVAYSPVVQHFWEFIDSVIYKVMDPKVAKSQVRELGSAVRAMLK